jgi:hypothetical protein
MMNFDNYWLSLIERVYTERSELNGVEERFYRLSCICGENWVGGIFGYFMQRFHEFEADIVTLRDIGFSNLASELELARKLLFGAAKLDSETVYAKIMRDPEEDFIENYDQVLEIMDRISPYLDQVHDYRYSLGLDAGLFYED